VGKTNIRRRVLAINILATSQEMPGKFAPRVFNELLKGDAGVSKPMLKRARVRGEFLSDFLQSWTLPRE
jgi:hypothetical protein